METRSLTWVVPSFDVTRGTWVYDSVSNVGGKVLEIWGTRDQGALTLVVEGKKGRAEISLAGLHDLSLLH